MIYLDNAATTRIDPEVLDSMMPYLTTQYGNAGSLYSLGRESKKAVDLAREQVATLFGCTPEHVIFTSGGSESNNMVFRGLRHSLAESNRREIVVSAVEHDSVLRAAESLTKDGFYITYVAPDEIGAILPRTVGESIKEQTGLVSVMFSNNETGTVNNIKSIGSLCRTSNRYFHVDCVQAAGQYPLSVDENYIDFASVSSHKIHGPKGVGALYLRDRCLSPLVCGGADQEFGLRGGTENVAGIVGFGKAAELAVQNMKQDITYVSVLKQTFFTEFLSAAERLGFPRDHIHVNGQNVVVPGKTLNLRLDGVDAETLILMLNTKGICISAGSACRSHEANPSHVLTAMGLTKDEARSSIRLSFSRFNTAAEIEEAAHTIVECVAFLSQANE